MATLELASFNNVYIRYTHTRCDSGIWEEVQDLKSLKNKKFFFDENKIKTGESRPKTKNLITRS